MAHRSDNAGKVLWEVLQQAAAIGRRYRIHGRQGPQPLSRAFGGRAHRSNCWPGGDEMIARSQHEGVLTLRLGRVDNS
jgi:hypothetical protein